MPVISATLKAEAGESLEPKRLELRSCHYTPAWVIKWGEKKILLEKVRWALMMKGLESKARGLILFKEKL